MPMLRAMAHRLLRLPSRFVLLALIVAVLPAAAHAAYTGHRLYAVEDGNASGTLVPFDVDADGTPHERSDQAVAVPAETTGLLVDRQARSVFVSSRETIGFGFPWTITPGTIKVFTIGADGALTLAQTVASSWFAATLTPDGSRLFAQQVTGEIDSYAIEADGTLGAEDTHYAFTQPANAFAVSPDGASLYMDGQNALGFQWAIEPDASLTDLTPGLFAMPCQSPFIGLGVGSANVDVQCYNGTISTFSRGADGTLTPNGGAAASSDGQYGNAEDARGRAFYTGSGSYGIDQLERQADGTLAPFAPASVPSPGQTQALAVDPDGTVLTVATGTNGLETYAIAADGSLSAAPVATTPIAMRPPNFLAYSPQQAPAASFTAAPTAAGATSFDAGASRAFDGRAIARYDWSFGDGTTLADAGPAPNHTYAKPGVYAATLSVTDSAGCSTAGTFNGSMSICAGSDRAAVSERVEVTGATPLPLAAATVPAIRLAAPTPLTVTPGGHGRHVLLSWRAPAGAPATTHYLIAWSTTASPAGPGDRRVHHLHWNTRAHILMRGARRGTTLHYAVYAYGPEGKLSRGAKATIHITG